MNEERKRNRYRYIIIINMCLLSKIFYIKVYDKVVFEGIKLCI